MTESKLKSKYRTKAVDSFKTKYKLYLFNLAINRELEVCLTSFQKFSISDSLVRQYTAEYWQQQLDYEGINNIPIADIEKAIKRLEIVGKSVFEKLKTDYIKGFRSSFSYEKFKSLLESDHCHYCKVTLVQIERLADKKQIFKKNLRGWTLEIDRLNSNFEYSEENCVMSCYWCNNAKTDEFTKEEFEAIGAKIGEIWQQRLMTQ